MKEISFCLIILLYSLAAYPKGWFGAYQMKGTLIDKKTKLPLPNVKFVIKGNAVKSDANGNYEATISWATCDRGRTIRIWICNSKENKKIEIKKAGDSTSIYIKSHWRKYGLRTYQGFSNKDKKEITYLKDIYI